MNDREMRSRRLLVGLVGMALLLIAVWSYSTMLAARAEAITANNDLVACRGMVSSIKQLSDQPRLVALEASSQTSVSEQVDNRRKGGGRDTDAVRTVEPLQSERISRSQYVNQQTRITIEDATLRQILQLARDLEANTAGFRVRDLVLTISENAGRNRELWDADAVLTQTVFSPTTN